MIATDAGRTASPAPPPPPGPSWLRRHPVLAAFGLLAGLSLFAAYWPASAIVTGVLVAGRATGVDRMLLGAARRVTTAAWQRIRDRGRPEPSPEPPVAGEPAPPPPPPPSSPSPTLPDPSGRARRARPPVAGPARARDGVDGL